MDICVAPYKNKSDFYFSPMKAFEYMALRKPVVAAAVGQLNELISDRKTGLLYKPENPTHLSYLIQELIDDLVLRKKIGNNAYSWVRKNRTWDTNAKMILKCANNILKTGDNI